MEDTLLTYRNLQPDPKRFSVDFLYHNNNLQKAAREKRLDPFPYKVSLHPSQLKK